MIASPARSYTALECEREARTWLALARDSKKSGNRDVVARAVRSARYWWRCAREARRHCWCNGTRVMVADFDQHTGYHEEVPCPDCTAPGALEGDDGRSVWQRCTPALLATGIDCGTVKRRAGLGGVGHDHLVPIASPALVDHDTPAGHLRNALQILTLGRELEPYSPMAGDMVAAVSERIHSALKGLETR
jgi:hypothetical protein